MLCAKYDYKMDIEVKQEEAFQDGQEAGLAQGAHDKAIESARNLLSMNLGTPEQIAQATGLSLKEVISLKNNN